MEFYREQLWRALQAVNPPELEELTDARYGAEMQRRIRADGFDGGRTAAWARSLGRCVSVRDRRTGHTVHCWSQRSREELTPDLILGLRLLAWMRSNKNNDAVTWYWWDQPWVRRLPARTVPGRDHINGGWATPGIPEVHVYRREEAHKVLLHEAVHALGLDVPAALLDPIRVEFERRLGGRRLWPHIGEAFTELFAEWLWAIAGARSLSDARRRWAAQRACARRQAAIVWSRIRETDAAEDTNVFAYYVLKFVLMLHEETVIITPTASSRWWLDWWDAALPALNRIAVLARRSGTDDREIAMGMTCE
jgi:hypothetical protein